MPTVELFWFTASEAYESDPIVLAAPLRKLFPVPGCNESGAATFKLPGMMMLILNDRIFYGNTEPIKGSKVFCALCKFSASHIDNGGAERSTVWEQYEDHINFIKAPEYRDMVKDIDVSIGGNAQMKHIDFNGDATAPLQAAQTELSILTLKPDQNLDELKQAIEKYTESKTSSGITAFYGETKEDPGKFVLVAGLGAKVCVADICDL